MEKSWELTPQQKEKINKMQDKHMYEKFVMQQEDEFVKVMNFVNNIVNNMIENREVTAFTQIRARIKSVKSVLINASIKAVDDVFGIEIITPTEQEYEKIIEELKRWMSIQKEKKHDKPNGYKATHLAMTLRKENIDIVDIEEDRYEEIPMIEFQFKTIEVMIKASKGGAAHTKYKGEDLEEIQRRYDAGEFSYEKDGFFELPTMWKSRKRKNGFIK